MNSIQELVNQLQILHEELTNLEKRKRTRNILKVIGIGFLLYRDVDQEISKVQNKISDLGAQGNSAAEELLQQITLEVDKISNSQTYLQKSEEEKWLSLLKRFESNTNYLRSVNALDEQQSSKLLDEISKSKRISYNAINKRLDRTGLPMRIKQLRSFYATKMRETGLLSEQIDLVQGRVGKSIFLQHYFKQDAKLLSNRILQLLPKLEETLLS